MKRPLLLFCLCGALVRAQETALDPAPETTHENVHDNTHDKTHTARLKELVSIEGVRDNQLIGYGLVVGLNSTGDHQTTYFSAQSLANMLQQMGVSVNPGQLLVKDTAAVMVMDFPAARESLCCRIGSCQLPGNGELACGSPKRNRSRSYSIKG